MVRRHGVVEAALESQTTASMQESKPQVKAYLGFIYLFIIVCGDKTVNDIQFLLTGTLV